MSTSATVQADAAYQAVRALNHLTLPGQCESTDAADIYLIVASLASAIHAMPQALRQVAEWLTREITAGGIRVVAGPYVGQADVLVAAACRHLVEAGAQLGSAGGEITAVHNVLADVATDGDINR